MMMFIKENFNYSGGYLTYDGKFVARFKYAKDHNQFKNFLIKNFVQSEYFDRLANGESPLGVLGSKGYVPAHVKKYLIKMGFEPNTNGLKEWSRAAQAQQLTA
jgi:hypothetical protein